MDGYVWTRSRYKIFLKNWGIPVILEAGYHIIQNITEVYIDEVSQEEKIADNIYLKNVLLPWPESSQLTCKELAYFSDGLKLVSPQIQQAIGNAVCCVALRYIAYSACDIQPEAFMAGAIQWASDTFGFPMPMIPVDFDVTAPPNGIYLFHFRDTVRDAVINAAFEQERILKENVLTQKLWQTLDSLRIQCIGDWFIDMICPIESITAFISELDELQLEIKGFTWWCLAGSGESGHKPCGVRGYYPDKYSGKSTGLFSEIAAQDFITFESNDAYRNYLLHEWPKCEEYKECYRPAFWIDWRL